MTPSVTFVSGRAETAKRIVASRIAVTMKARRIAEQKRTAPITPAQIHTQEYFGPILCLRATRAGMKVDDRVAPVVRPAEQLGELRLRQLFADCGDFCRGLIERFLTLLLLGYVEKKTRLLEIRVVLFPNADDRLERGLFLENDLGFFAVVPKIGLCRELV